MAIGHHIGERSHIIERESNRGNDVEERQEFINLDEGVCGGGGMGVGGCRGEVCGCVCMYVFVVVHGVC